MSAWYAKPWSSLIINEIAFPVYSDLDINEEMAPREFGTLEDNINGVMRHMYGTNPANSRKVDITWSSSRVRRPPAFFSLWRGDQITVVPIEPWTMVLPAGQTELVLNRPPHPGTVLVEDQGTGEFLDVGSYGVVGSAVHLNAARGAPSIVGFRPVLTMLLDTRTSTRTEFAASASWRISAREK